MNSRSFIVFSGTNDRAVLAFLRALERCRERASIIACTSADRVLKTSYARDVVSIRNNWTLDIDIFKQCVADVRRSGVEHELVVLPSSEYFNSFLLRNRDEVERLGCSIPLVSAQDYALLTNKRTATQFFSNRGLDIPTEFASLDSTPLPAVAKPVNNLNASGESLYPLFLATNADVKDFRQSQNEADFFFQEFLSGCNLYLLFYISKSMCYDIVWSQQNFLQQPDGKSMLFATSAQIHESELASQVIHSLRQHRFHGLGMIEFIKKDDRITFIEMNPRIWGPMQLCVDQGVPILQAFIGDALHDEPERFCAPKYLAGSRWRRSYFWFGGFMDTLAAGQLPDWRGGRFLSLLRTAPTGLVNDVYFRMDSWRCFFSELNNSIVRSLKRGRSEK